MPRRELVFALSICLIVTTIFTGPVSAVTPSDTDFPAYTPGTHPIDPEKLGEEELLQRDLAFLSRRLAGDNPLSVNEAAVLRAAAADATKRLKNESAPTAGTTTFDASWTALGPNPIAQISRAPDGGGFTAMSGRIGALAIRPSTGQFVLGAAQGGIWLYNAGTGKWTPKTDGLGSLAIGALAIAPTNDAIIYAGTGEGALSGDSYFGNGILKSADGGQTWNHVSGDYFQAVSISRLIVDPANANHLYAAVLRGRGGARRTTPTDHSRFGIWESKDGAATWTLLKEAKSEANGATDVELDPQNTNTLYASFWGDAIYKSTNGGATWAKAMTGLPVADYAGAQTRFSISISHATPGGSGTLYAGFDWRDATGPHPSRVFKSTNGAASWSILPAGDPDKVEDYCGGQCFYDNVIEADPTDANIVFAAGQFDYGIGSGGVFRSTDGGQTWKDLGWDQHPDFHALAFDPSQTAHILIGSDGGVWFSPDRGGRTASGAPLEAVTWQSLNGTIDRTTGAIGVRSDLQIAQFTSIATVPTVPAGLDTERFWGGTQDNGTIRKSVNSKTWSDVASGDGGQVLVDPNDANYVYGTYFSISPYRYTNGGGVFFSNSFIRNGIDLNDRSDFYNPFVLNKLNTSQLFLGTYRLYRTDNSKAASAGDVKWKAISPDLTSGCTGIAPNGARNCTISAIGVGGGQAVYTGSLDGLVYLSTNAQVSDSPTWTRVGKNVLPNRPVTQIAVDPSNYRIAYVSYAGFDAATKNQPGHVYRTTDGGASWTNISGNLVDSPVNSVILDPSYPNTLYVGTDVGPMVTYDAGFTWSKLGSTFPIVSIWQLDLDPSHRIMAAGTHGRGAFRLADASAPVPSLVLSKVDAGTPVGPTSNITYTLTLRNIGNADATGVTITDPVPANTTFVSATNGGTNNSGTVTWSNLTIAKGGSTQVQFIVSIADALKKKVASIINDGVRATSDQGPYTTGSPFVTPVAPPYAVTVSPASQTDGGRPGTSVQYKVTLKNLGFNSDTYTMSATSTWAASFFDGASCTTTLTTTPSVAPGATTDVCVKVAIPTGTANDAVNTATVTATSTGNPSVSASATIKTIAVAVDTLLVDNDNNNPDVQSYYSAALSTANVSFSTWDLATDSNLPQNYMLAFKNIVWFTGNSYPAPITPYEARLTAFLDAGNHLFMSGQDILDQAAGTTTFVSNYLHITWDGTETQNDKPTDHVNGSATSPVTGVPTTIGAVALNHSVLGPDAEFEDRITPNGGAVAAFTDDTAAADALSFAGTYKVVFLAFPFEEYGTAGDKVDLVNRVMAFFAP